MQRFAPHLVQAIYIIVYGTASCLIARRGWMDFLSLPFSSGSVHSAKAPNIISQFETSGLEESVPAHQMGEGSRLYNVSCFLLVKLPLR